MANPDLVLVVILCMGFAVRSVHSAKCTQVGYKSCSSSQRYTEGCGVFGWARCSAYRTTYHSCTKSVDVCCTGWTGNVGAGCPTPICSNGCPNGGTCNLPNDCNCVAGYYSPNCAACSLSRISNCARITCSRGPSNFRCQECRLQSAVGSAYVPSSDKTYCRATCSWLNHMCYPGTCSNGFPETCSCVSGFVKSGQSTCDLSTSNVPTLSQCRTFITDAGGTIKSTKSGSPNTCDNEEDVFVNIQPTTITISFDSTFQVTNVPAKPNFISTYSFGVVNKKVDLVKVAADSSETIKKTYALDGGECSPAYDVQNPKQAVTCEITNDNWSGGSFADGESLCMDFEAKSGGFYSTKNVITGAAANTHYYTPRPATSRVCFKFDFSKPEHCSLTDTCSSSNNMLDVGDRTRKDPNLVTSFPDWTDSHTASSSGIKEYIIEAFEVIEADLSTLKMGSKVANADPTTSTTISLTLPTDQTLYAIVLTVRDVAENFREVRRFVLYDQSSVIEADDNFPLYASTGTNETGYVWQTELKNPSVLWQRRFYNNFQKSTNLLRPINADARFEDAYDQLSGELPRSGTTNIHGITLFEYHLATDVTIEPPNYAPVPNFPAEFIDLTSTNPVDGDSFRFWIRSTDIMGNKKVESVIFHVDSTPPDLLDVWLSKDGRSSVFVHDSSDLSKMVLTFKGLDIHSGLRQVKWMLGTSEGSIDLGDGSLPVVEVETCPGGSECYCPVNQIGTCSYSRFNVDLNVLIAKGVHIGNHNREYHFNIEIQNNARFKSSTNVTILVDESPPHAGVVMDGGVGQNEIDYTAENTVKAHWSGFYDHESGVRFYRYAVTETPLTKAELIDLNNPVVKETSNTFINTQTEYTKYFVCVVAYNNAIAPSDAVCSDGVVVDVTPPVVYDLVIERARFLPSIICTGGDTLWHIGYEGKRQELASGASCSAKCQAQQPIDGALFPLLHNQTLDSAQSNKLCEMDGQNEFSVYLYKDSLGLSWKFEEPESMLNDFKIGVSSTSGNVVSPDKLAFTSTKTHTFFKKVHTAFGEATRFYIVLKATNKASVAAPAVHVIGPVVIDETAPKIDVPLTPILSSQRVDLQWRSDTFYDDEQGGPVTEFEYAIGSVGHLERVVPFTRLPDQSGCPGNKYCVKTPLKLLQGDDLDSNTSYVISIKAINRAGLYSVTESQSFTLPSLLPPISGIVMDVDPAHLLDLDKNMTDIDFQMQPKICAVWKRFDHHRISEISYNVALGTAAGGKDVSDYVDVGRNTDYCFEDVQLQNAQKYFVKVRATTSGGNAEVSSDGVTYLDPTKNNIEIRVYDGDGCDRKPDLEVLQESLSLSSQQTVTFTPTTKVKFPNRYTIAVTCDLQKGQSANIEVGVNGLVQQYTAVAYQNGAMNIYSSFISQDDQLTVSVKNKGDSLSVKKVALVFCDAQIDFHASNHAVGAWWEVKNNLPFIPTHYTLKLTEEICAIVNETGQVNCTDIGFVKQEQIVQEHMYIHFTDLQLDAGHKYRTHVSACYHHNCLQSSVSSGVTILPSIPEPSILVTSGSLIATSPNIKILFTIEWEPFLLKAGEFYQDVTWYEWSMSTNENHTEILVPWTKLILDEDHSGNVKVSKEVTVKVLHVRQIFAHVRGYSRAGKMSSSKAWSKVDTSLAEAVPLVYDVMARDLTAKTIPWFLSRKLNAYEQILHSLEMDYTKNLIEVAAAFTERGYPFYRWWVTSDKRITVEDCINKHPKCIYFIPTSTHYVKFPAMELNHGKKYFSCVHVNSTILKRGQSSVTLPRHDLCSNGFLVDKTPPLPGKVFIKSTDTKHQADRSQLVLSWDGFTDLEELSEIQHSSGIKSFAITIGSFSGGRDVVPWIDVGYTNHHVATGLKLEDGKTYYASVKATDYVGLTSVATSQGVTIDSTPPRAGYIRVGSAHDHVQIVHCENVEVHWEPLHDEHSQRTDFEIAVGSHPYSQDVLPFQPQSTDTVVLTDLNLIEGHHYYVILKTRNSAGLFTIVTSESFTCDATPPGPGIVWDGNAKTDIDYQRNTKEIYVQWTPFQDSMSSEKVTYSVSVGTKPGGDDVMSVLHIGPNKREFYAAMSLTMGETYYVTVEGCNVVQMCVKATSDGVTVDDSPPIVGRVTVGPDDIHDLYLAETNAICLRWFGFHDPHSRIHHYEWCLGTTKGQCDVLSYQMGHLSVHAMLAGLNLPVNTPMYATVKAVNNVGQEVEGHSDCFTIDNTPPEVVENPSFVTDKISWKAGTQFDPSVLMLAWKFSDSESPITDNVISVNTHHEGQPPISHMDLDSATSITISLKDDPLSEGDTYYVTVSACNAAGLCNSVESTGLLVDATPPHIGGFVEPLDWSYDGASTTISLKWKGFSDAHSNIETYTITVGRTYHNRSLLIEIQNHVDQDNPQSGTFTISVKPEPDEVYYFSVWAINEAGLRSDIGVVSAIVVKSNPAGTAGFFEIEKHSCDISFCDNVCSCGVVGKFCTHKGFGSNCSSVADANIISRIAVSDGVDENADDSYSGSSKCLVFTWKDTADAGVQGSQPVIRYEWSVSEKNATAGGGIFDLINDKIWFDAGLETSATFCHVVDDSNSMLLHNKFYEGHVRAWWSDTSFTEYVSSGVHLDQTEPGVAKLGGYSVVDIAVEGETEDIEFSTDTTRLGARWHKVFKDTQSGIKHYEVFIGFTPGGDEAVAVQNVGLDTSVVFTSLNLLPGKKYYTTVRAVNLLGMTNNKTSDGVLIDTAPPVAGVVNLGLSTQHFHYWHDKSAIDASWHGFDDLHSFIQYYEWGIGDSPDDANAVALQNVKQRVSVKNAAVNLEHNKQYYIIVQATDAAGMKTKASSPEFLLDETPPQAVLCSAFGSPSSLSLPDVLTISDDQKHKIHRLVLKSDPPCSNIGHLRMAHVDVVTLFRPVQNECHFTIELPIRGFGTSVELSFSSPSVMLKSAFVETCSTQQPLSIENAPNAISVVQTGKTEVSISWNIVDEESGIGNYIVGLGTVPGGFQLVWANNVGTIPYHTASEIGAMHNQQVYASVTAHNKAGIPLNLLSGPLTIDWTPPDVKDIALSYDVKANKAVAVTGTWSTHDSETDVTHCRWKIGANQGEGDIMDWTAAHGLTSDVSPDMNVAHGTELHLTIQCTNNAGLHSTVYATPVKVVSEPPNSDNAYVEFVTLSDTEYQPNAAYHWQNHPIQVTFGGFIDITGIDHYSVSIGKTDSNTENWESVGYMTDIVYSDLELELATNYTVKVKATNSKGLVSGIASSTFKTQEDPSSVSLTGTAAKFASENGQAVLKWPGVFSNPRDLVYEVSVGNDKDDVLFMQWKETKNTQITINNMPMNKNYYVVITAIKPAGVYVTYEAKLFLA